MDTIPEFYSGKQIFITGGSGFIGKVLIEKLLRSCPDIDIIFILMREKKGKSAQERLFDIFKLPLFDVLREKGPAPFKKVIPIEGNVSLLGMGISQVDLKLMGNVSIIFHAAASVRFDDPLRDAILMNTRGTRELMRFAETLKYLKVLVHVSTTYCNPDKYVIEEKLYPPYTDWKVAINIAENLDLETINAFTDKLSCYLPNTYTFTKSMSEHVVNDYKEKIPVLIYRPSIVISTIEEPMPGWIDNFNGPVGMLVGSGIGILRTIYAKPDVISDFTPVDVVIKGLLIAAFEKGKANENNGDMPIYNCSTSSLRGITTGYIATLAKELIIRKPFAQMIWVPDGTITTSKKINFIKFIFYHVLFACLVDGLAKVFNKKPFLLRLQRRIYGANLAVAYFIMKDWKFINNNFVALDEKIPPSDVRNFAFLHFKDMDVKEFFYKALVGARIHLLKETDDNLQYAKRKFWIIYYLNKLIKYVVYGFIFNIILTKFNILRLLEPILMRDKINSY